MASLHYNNYGEIIENIAEGQLSFLKSYKNKVDLYIFRTVQRYSFLEAEHESKASKRP
jgi:hypothetical protein